MMGERSSTIGITCSWLGKSALEHDERQRGQGGRLRAGRSGKRCIEEGRLEPVLGGHDGLGIPVFRGHGNRIAQRSASDAPRDRIHCSSTTSPLRWRGMLTGGTEARIMPHSATRVAFWGIVHEIDRGERCAVAGPVTLAMAEVALILVDPRPDRLPRGPVVHGDLRICDRIKNLFMAKAYLRAYLWGS